MSADREVIIRLSVQVANTKLPAPDVQEIVAAQNEVRAATEAAGYALQGEGYEIREADKAMLEMVNTEQEAVVATEKLADAHERAGRAAGGHGGSLHSMARPMNMILHSSMQLTKSILELSAANEKDAEEMVRKFMKYEAYFGILTGGIHLIHGMSRAYEIMTASANKAAVAQMLAMGPWVAAAAVAGTIVYALARAWDVGGNAARAAAREFSEARIEFEKLQTKMVEHSGKLETSGHGAAEKQASEKHFVKEVERGRAHREQEIKDAEAHATRLAATRRMKTGDVDKSGIEEAEAQSNVQKTRGIELSEDAAEKAAKVVEITKQQVEQEKSVEAAQKAVEMATRRQIEARAEAEKNALIAHRHDINGKAVGGDHTFGERYEANMKEEELAQRVKETTAEVEEAHKRLTAAKEKGLEITDREREAIHASVEAQQKVVESLHSQLELRMKAIEAADALVAHEQKNVRSASKGYGQMTPQERAAALARAKRIGAGTATDADWKHALQDPNEDIRRKAEDHMEKKGQADADAANFAATGRHLTGKGSKLEQAEQDKALAEGGGGDKGQSVAELKKKIDDQEVALAKMNKELAESVSKAFAAFMKNVEWLKKEFERQERAAAALRNSK